jgi:hypothetical protein
MLLEGVTLLVSEQHFLAVLSGKNSLSMWLLILFSVKFCGLIRERYVRVRVISGWLKAESGGLPSLDSGIVGTKMN